MRLNDLPEGWYKVRQQQYSAYGAKHPRKNDNPVELLLVKGRAHEKMYYFGGNLVGQRPGDVTYLDSYEIVSKYDGEPVITDCMISITFRDRAGDEFVFSVKDAWGLRNLFDAFRWLRKPFGYVARNGTGR